MAANPEPVDPLASLLAERFRLFDPDDSGPDFFDNPFTELDSRFICRAEDWREYLQDLDRIQRAPHRMADPEEYPCYVTTAFLNGEWVHQTLGISWLGYMQDIMSGRTNGKLRVPGQFRQRVRVKRPRARQ